MEGWKSFWNPLVLPRVLAFCWFARWHSILTIDKLERRNHIIVSGCPVCLQDKEAVHHLMIHCRFAYCVWLVVLTMLALQWVISRHVDDLFCQWRVGRKFVHGKILWKLVMYSTLWKLWFERNHRVFHNKSHSVEDIFEYIVWSMSEWAHEKGV